MFNVGDKLRVRSWDDMATRYGYYGSNNCLNIDEILFLQEMKYLCGGEFTVKGFEKCGAKDQLRYYSEEGIELDGSGYKCWIITEGMLEYAPDYIDEDIADVSEDCFMEILEGGMTYA